MTKRLLPLILLAFLINHSSAQLVVENNLTVQQYVQDVLLGQNVSVSNITFNGGSANVVLPAVGGFESIDSNIGIESGFIMTCGDAAGTVGPNNQTGYTGTGPGGFSGTDPDLLDLVQANGGNSIHDWVILEFDFIPLGDTIRFNYIWGSEEYDTFVGSGFNDVFGFFLSGPGINGPFSNNAENIALVPGTDDGVAINTVNNGNGNAGPCNNCEYYNQLGSDGDFFNNQDDDIYTNPYYMQYDGFTDVLTAFAIVQCGQTYHIKLAVTDANDSILDSGVFLQRDSFSSNLVVQVELNLDVSGPDGNTLFENCGEGFITFERPESGNPEIELVAYLTYSGTAENGVDYTLLPDSVVFPPGVMFINLPLDAFDDGVLEGSETVHMEIENIADCGESMVSSEFDFFINDEAEPLVVEGYDVQICSGGTTTLEPIITGGYAVYGYDWSTNETTPTIDVSPPGTTTYFLTVTDTCGMPSDDASFMVEVLQTPELIVSIDQGDEVEVDCNMGMNITATAEGGINPYSWSWFDEDGFNLWGWENSVWVSAWSAGMVFVEVEDNCGFTALDSILVTLDVPALVLDVPATVNAPCGQQFQVTAEASGGVPTYWFNWAWNGVPDWNQWTETYTGTADEPGTITVTASDNCGQTVSQDIEVTIDSPPIELTLIDSVQGNCQTPFTFNPEIAGGSGGFEYSWTENGSEIGTQSSLIFTSDETTNVMLHVTDVCGAEASDEVVVTIVNPPILLSIGEDINASCIDNTMIAPEVSGGSGPLAFEWFVGGQVQEDETNPTITVQSFNTVQVSVIVSDFCGETANDNLTIFIPDIPLAITAGPDTVICPLMTVTMSALAEGGEGGFDYSWTEIEQNGSEATVNPVTTNTYTVVAEDICGETISTEVTVIVRPANADFVVTDLGDNLYTFTATPGASCGEEPCIFDWLISDGFTSTEQVIEHEFDGLGNYTVGLTVTNDLGCTDVSYYTIIGPPLIYIPNSFTPNGDGVNDVFSVVATSLLEYEINIFNRWGEVVFTSTDPSEVWLGDTGNNKDFYSKDGVYSYVVRVKGYDSDSYKEKGTITMIR